MADLETVSLAHLPDSLEAHIALYRDLQNAPFLHQQLLQGNSDFEYAFIDASVIISKTHVFAAVFRAANDYLHDRLKSRNVHSEIVYSLSINNNISSSFSTFGITPKTNSLLAIKLSTNPNITRSSVASHLRSCIEGTSLSFDDANLRTLTDLDKVKKIYKLAGAVTSTSEKSTTRGKANNMIQGPDKDDEVQWQELEAMILGSMALKGAT